MIQEIKYFQAGIWRGVKQSLSFMEATALKSLGGELDPDNAGKVSAADLFSTADLFSAPSFGANVPNPTPAQGTAP